MSWIKVKHGLLDDPAVILICRMTDLDEFSVIGRLVKIWQWADLHCVPTCNDSCNADVTVGNAPGVTEKWIDRYLGVNGFAAALVEAKWLFITSDGVQFPNFDRHMSQSAKQRALTAKRVSSHRGKSNANGNAPSNAPTVTDALTKSLDRGDKIRGEKVKKKKEAEPLPPDQIVFTYPCDGDPGSWQLSKSQVSRWSELYPKLDVLDECRKALAWVESNPTNRKTAGRMGSFLNGWLGRATNRPTAPVQPVRPSFTPKPPTPSFTERLAAEQAAKAPAVSLFTLEAKNV